MFKKILSLILVVLMLTLCCACNTGTENGTTKYDFLVSPINLYCLISY